jgi:hypothetical protein
MNVFQKQLLLRDDKSMAELSNPARVGVGQPLPPVKVSVEEWYGGAPNQHCGECRRLGICAYHRDYPHNLGSRKE